MAKHTQADIARKLGLATSFFCHIINGQRRPSPRKALELERKTGIGRMVWLYGNHLELRQKLEEKFGEINFSKGRPRKRRADE